MRAREFHPLDALGPTSASDRSNQGCPAKLYWLRRLQALALANSRSCHAAPPPVCGPYPTAYPLAAPPCHSVDWIAVSRVFQAFRLLHMLRSDDPRLPTTAISRLRRDLTWWDGRLSRSFTCLSTANEFLQHTLPPLTAKQYISAMQAPAPSKLRL